MNLKNKKSFSFLIIWIVTLIGIGSFIGFLIKPKINIWYNTLNQAPLTPPNYMFSIIWTILYAIIGICGWLIWQKQSLPNLKVIKTLYITQLILNYSWPLLFFNCHLIRVSLIILNLMNTIIGIIILKTYDKIRLASLLMIPYLLWSTFANYLNFYIWWHN